MARLRILHLSDTHVFGDDSRHYGVTDTADQLRRALARLEDEQMDLVVCSGDVSEDGTEASYERIRTLLGSWAAAHDAALVFAMGNHDRRSAFRAVLGDGQEAARALPGADADRPIASVREYDGWRVIVLDSSVPGAGYGAIDAAQQEFLSEVLATSAEHGSVLVVHHPPVRSQTTLLQALALGDEDIAWLRETLRSSDVRLILSGHYHLPITETFAGAVVNVAPGITNVNRPFVAAEEEVAVDAFGGARIEIDDDDIRIVPFIEQRDEKEVFHMDADITARIAAEAGRPESPAA